jgi:hypothetical protein
MDAARRQAILEHVRSFPQMTLAELVGAKGDIGRLAAELTVGELMGVSGGRRGKGSGRKAGSESRVGAVKTRSVADRAVYDASVLKLLSSAKDPLLAVRVRDAVGGTPLQARASLHRLVKARKVKRHGRARATTYAAK